MVLAVASEPVFRERGCTRVLDHGFVHCNDARFGPHRVVELRRLEGLAKLGIPVRIAGTIERQHRNVVHAQMVGMRVTGLVIAIGDHHLRLRPADDGNQTTNCFVKISLVEAARMLIRRRLGHARVAIAEHLDLVEADDGCCGSQLRRPHRGHKCPLLIGLKTVERLPFLAQGGVLEIALFATGATDENRVDTVGAILGKRRRAF